MFLHNMDIHGTIESYYMANILLMIETMTLKYRVPHGPYIQFAKVRNSLVGV